jgi:hypothetical protein
LQQSFVYYLSHTYIVLLEKKCGYGEWPWPIGHLNFLPIKKMKLSGGKKIFIN